MSSHYRKGPVMGDFFPRHCPGQPAIPRNGRRAIVARNLPRIQWEPEPFTPLIKLFGCGRGE
jgi:hypothetical protein